MVLHRFKAVGIIEAPPATTFEYILPGPLRLHWDKQVKVCICKVRHSLVLFFTFSFFQVLRDCDSGTRGE